MDKVSSVTQDITSSSTRTTNYSYDENFQVTTVQQGSREVRTVYDERGLVYTKTAENGSNDAVTEFTYDGNRNTTAVKNPRAKTTTVEYDLFDRSTKSINALGHYGETVYDKGSRATESKFYEEAGTTDVLKAHHKATFDEMGRAWKQEDLLQGASDTWYSRTVVFDKRSLVTKSTDRRSYDTEIVYDGAGRRLSVEDPLGNLAEWDYDANGNATTVTQTEIVPGGGTEAFETTFEYDAINRVKKQTVIDRTNGSNTKIAEWKRDALGVVRKQIDPKGWETTRVRDGLGRITEERRDMGSAAEIVTKWEYDEFDAVTKLTDDSNSDTLYAYDVLGRLTTKTYENTKTVSYAYDKNNNVTSITDQNGSVFAQTFDDIDRLTARDITRASGVGGDTDEDFAYDALNRLTEAKDNDSIVQLTYDSLSRVLTEVQGDNPLASSGKTTSYSHDAEGNRTKIDYPSGFDANEARDALGRISAITDGSSASIASFDLYGAGLRKKKTTFGNTTTANFSYDGFRRPTEIAHKTSTPTTFASFEYGWDKNDNPTYEARSHQSGKGDVYSYDRANRLINVKTDCDDPAAEVATPGTEVYVKKLEYDMDDVFNLTAYKVTPYGGSTTTTSYTTNAMNEYTAIGGTSLSYTDAGSLEDDGTYEYEYDAHQHLIRVILKSNSSTVATYKYDALGLGRRIKKTVGSDVTRYVYAGQQSIEEYDGSGNLARLFVFGERIDEVLTMESADHADVDGDSNTTETVRLTFHTQLIGSVTHVTAPNQAVVESYVYDPYGKVTMKNAGGSTISASAVTNPYLYTGRQLDEETGLYYYRARHYSAELRRFIQRDTLGEGIDGNRLEYGWSGPVAFGDPTGQAPKSRWTKSGIAGPDSSSWDGPYRTIVLQADGCYSITLDWIERVYATEIEEEERWREPSGATAEERLAALQESFINLKSDLARDAHRTADEANRGAQAEIDKIRDDARNAITDAALDLLPYAGWFTAGKKGRAVLKAHGVKDVWDVQNGTYQNGRTALEAMAGIGNSPSDSIGSTASDGFRDAIASIDAALARDAEAAAGRTEGRWEKTGRTRNAKRELKRVNRHRLRILVCPFTWGGCRFFLPTDISSSVSLGRIPQGSFWSGGPAHPPGHGR